uniref:Uncharacterized protein n=1 Tax=Lotharella globosa TaxID=91324 RepID=A0A7S3YQU7_9EUKA
MTMHMHVVDKGNTRDAESPGFCARGSIEKHALVSAGGWCAGGEKNPGTQSDHARATVVKVAKKRIQVRILNRCQTIIVIVTVVVTSVIAPVGIVIIIVVITVLVLILNNEVPFYTVTITSTVASISENHISIFVLGIIQLCGLRVGRFRTSNTNIPC